MISAKNLPPPFRFFLPLVKIIEKIGFITSRILLIFGTPLMISGKIVFKLIDCIGRLTYISLKAVFKFFKIYFRPVFKTLFRVALFIQLIGEITLLIIFTGKVVVNSIFILFFKRSKTNRSHLVKAGKNYRKDLVRLNIGEFLVYCSGRLPKLQLHRPTLAAAVSFVFILLLSGVYYFGFFINLPSPYDLSGKPLPQSSRIFDKNGKLLYITYNGKTNRIPVKLSTLPPYVEQATLAVEDNDFYHHTGVSIRGIARALVNNIKHEKTQGGSTITQQLVKIALLQDNRRIITRKIKEAYLALLVERAYDKKTILEAYLNNAPYGGTAYGIEAAARKYFGKEASQLTLAESALLASLPSAPSIYSPYISKETVYKMNQRTTLDKMRELKYITAQQAEDAFNEKLTFYSIENQIQAPHFVFWVIDDLEHKLGKTLVQEGGLDIFTTLDLTTQLKAEQIVKENVDKLEKPYWISNAAALVTEPNTGKITAMVGSREYFDEKHQGQVNVTVSKRQPGSSIKVVNYAYALSKGGFTPSTMIDDSPVTYANAWESYTPVNYDGKYRGRVTLKQALAMSLNIPAVKVLNTYGPDKMVELGIKMGIDSWKDLKNYGLSLTLGAGEVKMTELATVYGTFANLGKRVDLHSVDKIIDRNGKVISDASNINNKSILGVSTVKAADDNKVLPEYSAYQITTILSDNNARLPAFGPYAKLEIPGHKVAVKTGTTNNIRDNWTIGYTPDVLVATWVGNNDNSPMNPGLTSGITGAAPIWNEIMSNMLNGKPAEEYATPSGMIKVKVCAVNGLLTCARCPKESEEYFAPGQEPKTKCYFPSAEECAAKKSQMEGEGKNPDEIGRALVNCPAETAKPN